ncbi:hypothetical protein ACJX0J_038473 [Zea mays]
MCPFTLDLNVCSTASKVYIILGIKEDKSYLLLSFKIIHLFLCQCIIEAHGQSVLAEYQSSLNDVSVNPIEKGHENHICMLTHYDFCKLMKEFPIQVLMGFKCYDLIVNIDNTSVGILKLVLKVRH